MNQNYPQHAAAVIRRYRPNFNPKLALVLGSGLGELPKQFNNVTTIPYQEIPGFPMSTVPGHHNQLVLGELEGVPIVCLQGRVHYYEGAENSKIKNMIRTLQQLGCQTLLTTNAAGSLNSKVLPGSVMLIKDHINMQANNPLIGQNDESYGERFIAMDNAYDAQLRNRLKKIAEKNQIELTEGVYIAVLGPMFETPAEINAFRILGADAVGMSTVAEVIVARHCGLKVLAMSAITNLASGMSDESISHDGTLKFAAQAGKKIMQLIKGFLND